MLINSNPSNCGRLFVTGISLLFELTYTYMAEIRDMIKLMSVSKKYSSDSTHDISELFSIYFVLFLLHFLCMEDQSLFYFRKDIPVTAWGDDIFVWYSARLGSALLCMPQGMRAASVTRCPWVVSRMLWVVNTQLHQTVISESLMKLPNA